MSRHPIRTPVFAGNWKMNKGPSQTRAFFASFLPLCPPRGDRTVIIFPPALSLSSARESRGERQDIELGVQNVFWEESGPFTGEISAGMVADAGARFVLVGHSDRRHRFGESSQDAARKVQAAWRAGLVAVLCVGETLEQRREGHAELVVHEQLNPVLEGGRTDPARALMIAYEPVWAIGTGVAARPEDAAAMHRVIRTTLARALGSDVAGTIPILYGGSVTPENVASLLECGEIDGVLVGGASLDPASFAAICGAG
jgi:triosephosphate isomerase